MVYIDWKRTGINTFITVLAYCCSQTSTIRFTKAIPDSDERIILLEKMIKNQYKNPHLKSLEHHPDGWDGAVVETRNTN